VAAVSVRGTGDSGGCMDLMGVKEIADLDQAVTWLGQQEWSNGNVGMIGLSYDGSTPWSVAATGNPHLKTIVPISGVPDVYGLMFRNGSAEERGPFLLNALYYAFFLRVYIPGGAEVPVYAIENTAEGAVCPESWVGLGAAAYSGATGARDPTGWWAERNRKPQVDENYQGSILSVQGMQDWNVDPHMVVPWVDELNRTGIPTKQLLGQWGHAYPDSYCSNVAHSLNPTCRWDWAEILLHWFDRWLYENPTIDTGPAVQVQDNQYRWRNEETYPPRDADWTHYNLAPNERLKLDAADYGEVLLTATGLAPETPGGNNKQTLPGYSADFTSDPVEETRLIAGLPRLHTTVTPHGNGGFLAAHLYTVDPTGAETLIGWTQMNLAFHDGGEDAKTVMPQEPIVAKLEFQPLDAVVPQGHSLRVRVWESTYSDRMPSVPPAPVTLQFGGDVHSVLEIPYVERGTPDFFQPPMPS
jgi:predicted acyl esterase